MIITLLIIIYIIGAALVTRIFIKNAINTGGATLRELFKIALMSLLSWLTLLLMLLVYIQDHLDDIIIKGKKK